MPERQVNNLSRLERESLWRDPDNSRPPFPDRGSHARNSSDRAAQAVHLRGACASDPHRRSARCAAHTDGHLSRDPYSGDQRDLAVRRTAARCDERPDHYAVSARADDDGQRRRAPRSHLVHRLRHREDLFSAERRYQHGECSGNGGLTDHAATDAARHHAAPDPQLQRIDGLGHPVRTVCSRHDRTGPGRSRSQHGAHGTHERPRRSDSLSIRRQDASDPDRPGSRCVAGARTVRPGCRERARGAEPDHSGRNSEDRRARVPDPAQQQRRGAGRSARIADQARGRSDGLFARCGQRARRQPAADEHRPCGWRPLGDRHRPEKWIGFDPGRDRGCEKGSRQTEGVAPRESRDQADRRSIHLRQRRDRRRGGGRCHCGRADQPDDSVVPGELALDSDHRHVHPAVDSGCARSARARRRDTQHHDARRPCARRRYSRRRRDGDHRKHQLAS